ncbi:MTOR-associated protein MEAK7 isoform X1 [Gopherus evgoodei]|uniref:MTOR-associated protein MEAK7 n=2 Tax=Gopherus evgoodei TaxID=1825980 RepID=A0A8C4YER4_9SAUR|nr:MTOR-associated protein MEAK7 isoform X1 [Gopherus evgoodei]XP_030437502.1 MTOR-associated protein MEAK7 isoform X1 [Gopherus evgoodei]XP_030437503.1 MTOR-associated protein MEAK7 isoform X1 [Gopherus evgoodei]
MGNVESGCYENHLSRFFPEEKTDIDGVFDTLSGLDGSGEVKIGKAPRKAVTLAMLKAHVQEALPEQMTFRLYNGMKSVDLTGKSPGSSEQIVKEQFIVFMSALLKGNVEEKCSIIMRMISSIEGPVKGKQIQEFTEDLITSVVHVLRSRNLLKGWNLEMTQDPASGVKTLASQLLSELKLEDGKKLVGPSLMDAMCDQSTIENWVFQVPQISTFLNVIIRQGLLVLHSLPDQANDLVKLVPKCKGIKGRGFVSLLDIPSIIYINSHLPSELQHKWRLLFSSRVHGESFSQLCGQIINQGPCILVLKDLDGYIFGGFASDSWEVKPQFQGDNRCFLFSVSPSLMVYTYTGYNDHYMYLNHGQQTIPNGLGMGGQHDYFGLWIDSNYGKGHSRAKPTCTTYNSPQLSANENFTLDAMEVWAVGDLPEGAVIKGKKSILNTDPEAQALLEMTGKSRQSDGLREQIEDDDDN